MADKSSTLAKINLPWGATITTNASNLFVVVVVAYMGWAARDMFMKMMASYEGIQAQVEDQGVRLQEVEAAVQENNQALDAVSTSVGSLAEAQEAASDRIDPFLRCARMKKGCS